VLNKSEAPVIRPMRLLPDHISLFLCPQRKGIVWPIARLCDEMPSTLTHNKVILYCAMRMICDCSAAAFSKGRDANGKWQITFICACFKCKCEVRGSQLSAAECRDTERSQIMKFCVLSLTLCTLCSAHCQSKIISTNLHFSQTIQTGGEAKYATS
jgi:hypothetical protein